MTKEEFKAVRKKMRITQGELAEMLGLHGKNHVCRIETGRTPCRPTISVLMRIFDVLGYDRIKEIQGPSK